MSREDTVALIRTSYHQKDKDDSPRLYLNGQTRDGREFRDYCGWDFKNLPPADQVAWAELDIDDDQCRDLIITLGAGGVVTGVRLESASIWEELRFSLARGTGWHGWPRARGRP